MELEIVSDVEELVEDEILKGEMVTEMGKLEEPLRFKEGSLFVLRSSHPGFFL